jgi:hypothetical protein
LIETFAGRTFAGKDKDKINNPPQSSNFRFGGVLNLFWGNNPSLKAGVIMKYKWLMIFFFAAFSHFVFGANFQRYYYVIENNADEDIYFTALSNETLRESWGIPYYEDGVAAGYLVPADWAEIIKQPVCAGTSVVPDISIDSTHFGVILTTHTVIRANNGKPEYAEPDGTDVIKAFFDQWKKMLNHFLFL